MDKRCCLTIEYANKIDIFVILYVLVMLAAANKHIVTATLHAKVSAGNTPFLFASA